MEKKQILEFQDELWNLTQKYVGTTDEDSVLATSAMLLKVTMQLYSVVLSDEEIIYLLDHVKNNIPETSKSMKELMGKRTLH